MATGAVGILTLHPSIPLWPFLPSIPELNHLDVCMFLRFVALSGDLPSLLTVVLAHTQNYLLYWGQVLGVPRKGSHHNCYFFYSSASVFGLCVCLCVCLCEGLGALGT